MTDTALYFTTTEADGLGESIAVLGAGQAETSAVIDRLEASMDKFEALIDELVRRLS